LRPAAFFLPADEPRAAFRLAIAVVLSSERSAAPEPEPLNDATWTLEPVRYLDSYR
jgi:hypothetical protein